MSLTFKDYKINHIALLFIKVLTLRKKQVKIQKIQCLRSVEYFPRLTKKWRNTSQSYCLIRSILDSYSISRKEYSIDWKEFSIGNRFWHLHCSSIENTFWFYQWKFTNQTLRFSISRSRTIIMLETLKT